MFLIILLISFGIISSAVAHKVLLAGSLEKHEHQYFEQVGASFTKTTENTVYILAHEQKTAADFEIKEISERFYSIQVPKLAGKAGETEIAALMARMSRFFWDPAATEEENFVKLDVEHVKGYFLTDPNTGG